MPLAAENMFFFHFFFYIILEPSYSKQHIFWEFFIQGQVFENKLITHIQQKPK